MAVYREIWTKQVKGEIKKNDDGDFLGGLEDYSMHVKNVGNESQVIHVTYLGVKPEVLINNTTYPILDQDLNAEDLLVVLAKFQSRPTPITDDELYAISYDKIGSTKKSHGQAIADEKKQKAIHSLAPGGNTVKMPVIVTTGEDDGTGRKRLQLKDIVVLKQKLDDLGISEQGRRLVLCSDHVNDLLLLDQAFKQQYYSYESGKIANMYGFNVYGYIAMPYYNPATKEKLSYKAVPASTDRKASVFFSVDYAIKADGWTKMYYEEAKTNPSMQMSRIAFRHNAIVMPLVEAKRGAIVSGNI